MEFEGLYRKLSNQFFGSFFLFQKGFFKYSGFNNSFIYLQTQTKKTFVIIFFMFVLSNTGLIVYQKIRWKIRPVRPAVDTDEPFEVMIGDNS